VCAATTAFAEMQGLAAHVPIYVAKPPRQSSAAASRSSRVNSAASSRTPNLVRPSSGASSAAPEQDPPADEQALDAHLGGHDLVVEPLDLDESDVALSAPPAVPAKPRVVRIKVAEAKAFSNYQKHVAARKAVEGQSVHVTSAGPYVSKLEQRALDDREAARRSIHSGAFKPGGLRKFSPSDNAGFAAAGFNLPDDLPQSAHRYGSFYNTHSHNFRHTGPKNNLYM